MSTWFKVNRYRTEIETVEVLSETPKYVVTINGLYNKLPMKHLKGTEYFPTFKEARQSLMDASTKKFDRLKQELEQERQITSKIIMMEPPTEKAKETNETAT